MDNFSDFLLSSGANFYDAMEGYDDVIPASYDSFEVGNNEENNKETAPAESFTDSHPLCSYFHHRLRSTTLPSMPCSKQ